MSEDWTAVLPADELADGKAMRAESPHGDLMLYRAGERLFAIALRCTHQGAPLDRGAVRIQTSMQTVTCPAHGSIFDLETGRVLRAPAAKRVEAFETRISDGQVEVRPRPET